MSSKIHKLINPIPPGALVFQKWLNEKDVSYSSAQHYAQSGRLKRLASGVYYRPDAQGDIKPTWIDAVDAIQTLYVQLEGPVHLAGLSSLTHQGLNPYLPLNKEQVWVYAQNKWSLPKWFRDFPYQNWFYCGNHKLELNSEKDLKRIRVKEKELLVSCAELAAYEVVDAIERLISFEHVAELFQSFVNLNPRKVQDILERSRSVRTNRVFLFLSRYYDHQWVKHLDETRIKLGAGKRQIVKKGRIDPRYQITVPERFSTKKGEKNSG